VADHVEELLFHYLASQEIDLNLAASYSMVADLGVLRYDPDEEEDEDKAIVFDFFEIFDCVVTDSLAQPGTPRAAVAALTEILAHAWTPKGIRSIVHKLVVRIAQDDDLFARLQVGNAEQKEHRRRGPKENRRKPEMIDHDPIFLELLSNLQRWGAISGWRFEHITGQGDVLIYTIVYSDTEFTIQPEDVESTICAIYEGWLAGRERFGVELTDEERDAIKRRQAD
jgi:hypothetical protein